MYVCGCVCGVCGVYVCVSVCVCVCVSVSHTWVGFNEQTACIVRSLLEKSLSVAEQMWDIVDVHLLPTCCISLFYLWHVSFWYMTCFFWHVLGLFLSPACVRHGVGMCDMTYSYGWHDSFIWVTWRVHMGDMTHSYGWHDFICVTWLIHMCDMTHPGLSFGDITKRLSTLWKDLAMPERAKVKSVCVCVDTCIERVWIERERVCMYA